MAFDNVLVRSSLDFGRLGLNFQGFELELSSFLAYFGHAFGCSGWWATPPPPEPPDLGVLPLVLFQIVGQLVRQNPRDCPGLSPEQNLYGLLQETADITAEFL